MLHHLRIFVAAVALAGTLGGPRFTPRPSPNVGSRGLIIATTAQVPAAPTQPPDAKSIRATIDLYAAGHVAKLQSFEAAYKVGRRNYFQSLISHSAIPADGAALAPDKLTSAPTDQFEKLSAFWSDAQLVALLPYAFKTDVYDGPAGQGYVLRVEVKLAGELWERSLNIGPELWRESAWHIVVPEP